MGAYRPELQFVSRAVLKYQNIEQTLFLNIKGARLFAQPNLIIYD